MLGHCLRRWPGIKTLLDKYILIIKCKYSIEGAGLCSRLLQWTPIIDRRDSINSINGISPGMYNIEPALIHLVIQYILDTSGRK